MSLDNGKSWEDTHGRSVGRHTTYFTVPLTTTTNTSSTKTLKIMAFGGKNSAVPSSVDGGATFAKAQKLPFPALATNQRPCVHRLFSGNLVFVGDFQMKGKGEQPPGFSPKRGETSGVYGAISRDDGATWRSSRCPLACRTRKTERTSALLVPWLQHSETGQKRCDPHP